MEAPSSAYHHGMLALGKHPQAEEETSCDSTPRRTSFLVASPGTPARWSLCILHQAGAILVHRNRPAAPEPCRTTIAPSREDVVVGIDCLFTGYWLADRCAPEGVPFVLGHALDMTAIHGGKATNDTIASQNIAVRLRGGLLPQAYVYPAAMRATRDRLRRRLQRTRQRAARLAHVQTTNSQDNRPELRQQLAYKANREGGAARFPDPAVQKSVEVDLALSAAYERLLSEVELTLVQTATQHPAQPLYRLHSVPGIGKIWSLVLRYESHALARFPRVQAVVS
jgi:hypothetical protein